MAAKGMPIAGLDTEAAIAPPINACAVAVTTNQYTHQVNLIQIAAYDTLEFAMLPVLFSIGSISVSSFGVFLALAFLTGIFIVWRLSRAWDLSEERILDLTLLSFAGGLIGARLFFVIENFRFFVSRPINIILVNKYPGFAFWGGFLGAWLTLFFFAKRFKADFRQFSDIALVGFLGGLILTDLGCFLGGCNVGNLTTSFLGVKMAGFVGNRWPVQIVEAILLGFVFLKIWAKATHFHQRGKIVSLGFIYIGLIKLILLPFKQDAPKEMFFVLILIILGFTMYYIVSGISPITHLHLLFRFLSALIKDPYARGKLVQDIKKYWYNQKANIGWNLRNIKKILRRLNVKFS